jgi:hypothetical protein
MSSTPVHVINLVLAEVPSEKWATHADEEILADLQYPVDNPLEQEMVLPYLTVNAVLGRMGSSLGNLATVPTIVAVRDDIRAQDHAGVGNWAVLYHAAGLITEAERNAVMTFLQTPVPDPNWSATIPWDVMTFGRPLDLSDIAETRSAYLASLEPAPEE